MDLRLPIPDALSETYWSAAAEGRLLIQRCTQCAHLQFYPRGHCVRCLHPAPVWIDASRTGTLHSFTIVRRTPNADWSDEVPYVFALVDLDEGVRITTNVRSADLESLRCGQGVEIHFEERDGVHVPVAHETSLERTN